MNFLFWNCGRSRLGRTISKLAHQHEIDVIVLAEVTDTPAQLLAELNKNSSFLFDFSQGQCRQVAHERQILVGPVPRLVVDHAERANRMA